MQLEGKTIAILVDEQYQELEVWVPFYRFVEEGAQVELVGPAAATTYPSKLGYPCVTTMSAAQALDVDFDAVLVPGGWCPDFMRRDADMVALIRKLAADGIVLAAICHGPWMLCSADALQGKRATSFMAIRHDVRNAGAEWVDEACVVAGNVITSRTPDDLPAFCRAIIEALA